MGRTSFERPDNFYFLNTRLETQQQNYLERKNCNTIFRHERRMRSMLKRMTSEAARSAEQKDRKKEKSRLTLNTNNYIVCVHCPTSNSHPRDKANTRRGGDVRCLLVSLTVLLQHFN